MAKNRKPKPHETKTPFTVLFDRVRRRSNPVTPSENGVLSQDEAIKVFDWLKSMDDLRHDYSNDLCYARAELMCYRLKQAGFEARKAQAAPYRDRRDDIDDDDMLRRNQMVLSISLDGGKHLLWGYHVAAALEVDVDGKTETMIFDPALFDGPASRSEWAAAMNTRSARVMTWAYESPGPMCMITGYSPSQERRLDQHPLVDAQTKIANIDEGRKTSLEPFKSEMRRKIRDKNHIPSDSRTCKQDI